MNKEQRKKYYTILLIPNSTGRLIKFRLPHIKWYKVGIVTALVVAVAGALIYDYKVTKIKLAETERRLGITKNLIIVQDKEIKELNVKAEAVLEQFERMKDLETDIKELIYQDGDVKQFDVVGVSEDEKAEALKKINQDVLTQVSGGPEEIPDQLDEILNEIPNISESLVEGKNDIEEQQYKLAHTPSIWPTWGVITTYFNNEKSSGVYIQGRHAGIDIANNSETPINSAADGVVIHASYAPYYGNLVIIDHDFGIRTVYGHLEQIDVDVGDHVEKDQTIGLMGSTGRSTGPHLHYEVRENNIPVNPFLYLP
ncbi:MAG: peptidoglycan DD-metalloendopeptidase family protein [Actinobacteria bacterium]|nr:peptidoglycan DD-metalloendopeptidase family protein [Actinomycetota bacterium]